MRARYIGAVGAFVLAGTLVQPLRAAPPLPSATDLWNSPATITYTVPGGGFPLAPLDNLFDGLADVSLANTAILANGKPPATVHTVEWTTASPVTVRSLNLFLAHDGRTAVDPNFKLRDARARGITKFELLADAGSGFEHIVTADVLLVDGDDEGPQPPGEPVCPSDECFGLYDPVYGGASLSVPAGASFVLLNSVAGYLTVSADIPATTADSWRAEFTQFGNFLDWYSDTGGSRIMELDGLPDPQFGAQAVALDIKPGKCPNTLNTLSQGVFSAAILGTDELDVTQIDLETLELEGAAPLRWKLRDVATPFEPFLGKEDALDCTAERADGFIDLTMKFDLHEVLAAFGEVEDGELLVLTLTGQLLEALGGTPIEGEDVVVVKLRE